MATSTSGDVGGGVSSRELIMKRSAVAMAKFCPWMRAYDEADVDPGREGDGAASATTAAAAAATTTPACDPALLGRSPHALSLPRRLRGRDTPTGGVGPMLSPGMPWA
eukprot:NODE_26394_length_552_cov_3.910588.p2 GENE.NODE_26394_length_552_cov_3.910588~~NODE_26394_length_552_cov_3.910588.p2  ORF type:complete len:108 (+),score=17.12 NODE_26394_length_552_cov_3.910588:186-509(+)